MPNFEPSPDQLRLISALADGTLDPSRREQARAQVEGSPELSELYARERQVITMLQAAAANDRAPAQLRAHLRARRPQRSVLVRRRAGYAGALAGALAAVALALILVLPGGTPGAPSVSQAAGLALRGPQTAAPGPDATAPRVKLREDVEGVYFPNLAPLHYRAVGERVDRLGGRRVVTVYYRSSSTLIAYTIVSAPALPEPSAPLSRVDNTVVRTLAVGHRLVVTWRRDGQTCVLSAAGVTPQALRVVAAWPPGVSR